MDGLPVGVAVRKDRLRRAAAMIVDHATRFCDALSEDFGHRSREQSLVTDIAGSVAPINHAIKHVDAWAAREKRKVQFPLGLLGARAWVEYQRSEEHTSELQSLMRISYAVFCLKKKT